MSNITFQIHMIHYNRITSNDFEHECNVDYDGGYNDDYDDRFNNGSEDRRTAAF